MGGFAKRLIYGMVGLVAVLAYWSLKRSGSASEGIPAQVWGGHGASLSIEVETSSPARFSVSFNERDKEDARYLETWSKVAAGSHSWTIDVPSRVGGYIGITAENPKVGDRLRFRIRVNGRVVDEQAETLEQALQEGYAFGLQAYFEDYSKGELGGGE